MAIDLCGHLGWVMLLLLKIGWEVIKEKRLCRQDYDWEFFPKYIFVHSPLHITQNIIYFFLPLIQDKLCIPVEPCHIFVPVLSHCHMLSFFVQCVKVRDECSFCLYWWNHLRSLFKLSFHNVLKGSSWLWSYSSWIYNYLCNQCLSLLNWVWIPLMEWCTRYNTMW